MTETVSLGAAVAFAAGLLSFLSPCVLPLVPSYLGFITGFTIEEMTGRRRLAMVHALLFSTGFSIVFILLGATATALGRALNYYQVWATRIGGVLIIGFGLYLLGVIKLSFLDQEQRVHLDRKPLGYLGSVLVGMAFGAGWTPCIGPMLGAILGLAASQDQVLARDRAARVLFGRARRAVPAHGLGRGELFRLVRKIPAAHAEGAARGRSPADPRGIVDGVRPVHPAGRMAAGAHPGGPPALAVVSCVCQR